MTCDHDQMRRDLPTWLASVETDYLQPFGDGIALRMGRCRACKSDIAAPGAGQPPGPFRPEPAVWAALGKGLVAR